MAQLKGTTVNGNLTVSGLTELEGGLNASGNITLSSLKVTGDINVDGNISAKSIKRNDSKNEILLDDGNTLTYGGNGNIIATVSDLNNKIKNLEDTINNTINNKRQVWNLEAITLDFTLDGTYLSNVVFENVGNGIFLSKNILKGISMDRLLAGGSDVGTGTIGKSAEGSIEAALKKQFGNSVSLRTYRRTYDGAAHAEKVFLPLESEVHGSGNMQYSANKKDIYPRWQIPNGNIKTGVNGWWWCANKSSFSGHFCVVSYNGNPYSDYSYNDYIGVALAFCL